MKRIIIYYYSGAGNTKFIANELQKQLISLQKEYKRRVDSSQSTNGILDEIEDLKTLIKSKKPKPKGHYQKVAASEFPSGKSRMEYELPDSSK